MWRFARSWSSKVEGGEGSNRPNWEPVVIVIVKCRNIRETVPEGQIPNLYDHWGDTNQRTLT